MATVAQHAGTFRQRLSRRKVAGRLFLALCLLAIGVALAMLAALLIDVFMDGLGRLSWDFITSFPSRRPERAGIFAALVGSVYVVALAAIIVFPIGVGAAVYLTEYARKNWFAEVVQTNISNLAGVPSIVYGILGLELFVRVMAMGRSVIAGALTLALLVLPIVIVASQEAIKAVPNSVREGSYALGATQWQTVWRLVLPQAFPGILTGVILAVSRAIGETAPLIVMGALTFVPYAPDGPFSRFTVLPIQIFNWVSRPQEGFHAAAAAGIIVLLAVLLSMNLAAILLRNYFQKRAQW